jgi:2-oxoglutarate/2-oxoacid ferredoxin oxidoreductase subunit alpha
MSTNGQGTNGKGTNGAAGLGVAAADRVNDFAFKVATVNGTGSASANGLILKCIYRMGIPVSGKNVFPSNIQGLPTWYELRVSRAGHVARTPRFDLIVAMNPATYQKDVTEVQAGGWILYDDSWPLQKALLRPDVTYLGVPLARMCVETFKGSRERILMKNIAYAGALAALIGLDMDIVKRLLDETYSRKKALLESNYTALALGYDYAREHFGALPLQLRAMEPDGEYVMMDGNTAAALGCVYAGATVGAWYPITPATSLMDNFRDLCKRYRTEPDGSKRYVILQAEDELAAAGMVVGAAWMGARAFTPTAGPGIDLMSEFIGLAYYTEIPCVFFDVQRTGPSTGMPTRTQQGDMTLVAYASHGDTKHIVLYPADPAECFYLSVAAFDLAERFQTPVFVLSDLDIGMNDWRIPRLRWDESYQWDRGKIFGEAELAKLKSFSRYLDVDGDGIAARTLPGISAKGAYFTRGSGHDKHGRYTEDEDAYQEVVDRLVHKLETARSSVPKPIVERREGAVAAIVCAGSSDAACREAIDVLTARGHRVDYMRVRAFPFAPEVDAFLASHATVFVVDQNRDGQLRTLLLNDTSAEKKQLRSVRHYSGTPLSAEHVLDEVLPVLEPEAEPAAPRLHPAAEPPRLQA